MKLRALAEKIAGAQTQVPEPQHLRDLIDIRTGGTLARWELDRLTDRLVRMVRLRVGRAA